MTQSPIFLVGFLGGGFFPPLAITSWHGRRDRWHGPTRLRLEEREEGGQEKPARQTPRPAHRSPTQNRWGLPCTDGGRRGGTPKPTLPPSSGLAEAEDSPWGLRAKSHSRAGSCSGGDGGGGGGGKAAGVPQTVRRALPPALTPCSPSARPGHDLR